MKIFSFHISFFFRYHVLGPSPGHNFMKGLCKNLMRNTIFIFFLLLVPNIHFAQKGKHGPLSFGNKDTVVNEFTALVSDATPGDLELIVTNPTLNANGRFQGPLEQGDLVLIVQMQGAEIKNANDKSWGRIQDLRNCGHHEFREVDSVPNDSTIRLACPLQKAYDQAGNTQIIRVPRFTTLTVENGANLTTEDWDGNTGGALVVETKGNVTIEANGRMDVTGKGFRGGRLDNEADYGYTGYASQDPVDGGEKGESIAGFGPVYDNKGGRYGRGAPANGGGGGNAHNGGGGGGANAGMAKDWTGAGNPDTSNPDWITAWNLEANGFSDTNSTGGGRGGYTYSSEDEDALSTPPGDPAWDGDGRRNGGGLGGRPLDYNGDRLFLGGGGGAGDGNNNGNAPGADGGGLVLLQSFGDINGDGAIIANGSEAQDTKNDGNDAPGGGGGGGTIVLKSAGTVNGISAKANGGKGGDQDIGNNEAEGPGGGGGGGHIAISNGTIYTEALGGNNGTTNSSALTEFIPNGATKGGAGVTGASVDPPLETKLNGLNDTICPGEKARLVAVLSPPPVSGATIKWFDTPTGSNVIGIGDTLITDPLYKDSSFYVGICPARSGKRDTVQVQVSHLKQDLSTSDDTCHGDCGGNLTVTPQNGFPPYVHSINGGNTWQNAPTFDSLCAGTYQVLTRDDIGCLDSSEISIDQPPKIELSVSDDTLICIDGSATLKAQASGGVQPLTYQWSHGLGDADQHKVSPDQDTTYQVYVRDSNGCRSATRTIGIKLLPPLLVNAYEDDTVCRGNSIQLSAEATGGDGDHRYSWSNGMQGNVIEVTPDSSTTYTATVEDGCETPSAKDSVTIEVTPYPEPHLEAEPREGCVPLQVSFKNTTDSIPRIQDCIWDFGNGTSQSGCEGPDLDYEKPGCYDVGLSVTTKTGCTKDTVFPELICVRPRPNANFKADPRKTSLLDPEVDFTNMSTGAQRSEWTIDTLGKSFATDTSYVFPNEGPGTYQVQLIAENQYGCRDSIEKSIVVREEFIVHVPNAFTPDGDGINESFGPVIQGHVPENYTFRIFNRWGTEVFRSENPEKRWKGLVNGSSARSGVYIWKLRVRSKTNKAFKEFTGHVTLVR